MHRHYHRAFLFVALWVLGHDIFGINGYMIGNDPTRRAEYLDPQGKYLLEWEVLWSSNRIVFNVTVQTRGFVAFGLANSDNEATAGGVDMLIGGVFQKGKVYFLDHHTYKGSYPKVDQSQDYTLHAAWETKAHTFISFSRPLDTCDPHDYPITENKVTLMWAYGEEDNHEFSWRYARRGTYEVYLLDPDFSLKILRERTTGAPRVISNEKLDVWTMTRRTRIPTNETAYICNMYKGPRLQRKHHIVGVDVHFPNEVSRRHVHHLLVYRCNVPQGLSSGIFEPFVGGQGQTCYLGTRPSSSSGPMPTHFCSELVYGWALGGRSIFFPPHVGVPFGSSPNEYYMIQVHYDNPQQLPNILVDFRIDYFYTSRLRRHDGGIMGLGHDVPGLAPSVLIPPSSTNHKIFSHCSSECTRRMFPTDIKVYAGILHSHNSGRRMHLRHFSSKDPNTEQPWILYDDNYSNTFQQYRHLQQERKILPGDQLTMECTYDTTWSNGSTVVGGFSTKQEMCLAYILYYNKIHDYHLCRSEIVSDEFRQRFLGIRNVSWIESQLDWVANDNNRRLAGLTVQQIADNYINWDWRMREDLQRFHEVHPHVGKCNRDLHARSPTALQALQQSGAFSGPPTSQVATSLNTNDDFHGMVGLPHRIRHYVPPKTCSYRGWYTKPLLK